MEVAPLSPPQNPSNMVFCNLSWLLFSFFFISTNIQVLAARILSSAAPPSPADQQITFFMQDVLGNKNPSLEQVGSGVTTTPIPFPKPGGLFPPKHGIPLPESVYESSGQGGGSVSGLPFLTNLHALEFGMVTVIEEELTNGYMSGSTMLGKVQGITVTSSDGSGGGQMIAMTARFSDGESGNSLRFFGLHHAGADESHIAVIGGTGKYYEANGYATVRTVAANNGSSNNKSLLVTVYLK